MPADNSNSDQPQNKIATALGRLRGDVMPPITSQAAPRLSDQLSAGMPASNQGFRAEPSLGGAANANPPTQQGPSISASFSAVPSTSAAAPAAMPSLAGGGIGNGAGVTPPLSATAPAGAGAPTGSGYFTSTGAAPTAGAQPDLLAGVDMGPPPLGTDYPRAEDNDARRRRNRRWALIGASVLVIAIAGYWIGTRHHGEVPVIAADATPEKVKPTDQGGMQVPNQNVQVLENMNGQAKPQGGETVLPAPEQPVAPPAPAATDQAAAQPAAPATTDQNIQVPSVPNPSVPSPAAAAPSAATPSVPAAVAPAPDATTASATPSVPAVPAVPTADSGAMTSSPAVPATPATTSTASAASATTAPATPATEPSTKPAANAANTVTATPGGKVRVQLAAVQSEAAAKTTWAKLQKQHPAQLGNLSLTVEKVDKGAAGIFYRVQAGPLADKAAAKQVCTALSAAGQACIIAH